MLPLPSQENAQCAQSLELRCGNMNRKLHQEPAAAGASFFISEVDDLIMFALFDAMFLRTDLTSRPWNSAFSHADNFGNAHLRKMSAETDKSFAMRTYEK